MSTRKAPARTPRYPETKPHTPINTTLPLGFTNPPYLAPPYRPTDPADIDVERAIERGDALYLGRLLQEARAREAARLTLETVRDADVELPTPDSQEWTDAFTAGWDNQDDVRRCVDQADLEEHLRTMIMEALMDMDPDARPAGLTEPPPDHPLVEALTRALTRTRVVLDADLTALRDKITEGWGGRYFDNLDAYHEALATALNKALEAE